MKNVKSIYLIATMLAIPCHNVFSAISQNAVNASTIDDITKKIEEASVSLNNTINKIERELPAGELKSRFNTVKNTLLDKRELHQELNSALKNLNNNLKAAEKYLSAVNKADATSKDVSDLQSTIAINKKAAGLVQQFLQTTESKRNELHLKATLDDQKIVNTESSVLTPPRNVAKKILQWTSR